MENTEKILLKDPRTAEKMGFSLAMNSNTISAYHDAARFNWPEGKSGRYAKRAFMRGWNNGWVAIHKVKQEITSGILVFVKYNGEYEDILSGKTTIPINDRNDERSVVAQQ